MKTELTDADYQAFLASYELPPEKGLRVNTLKGSAAELTKATGFSLTPVPWEKEGFYYDEERDRPGKHVLHKAGAYYIQEPSAMYPAALLQAEEGEVILDLCAAPGGKTTQLASAMKGRGLLVANEIHPARAKVLSENVERCGIKNCIVLNETPERLAQRFPSFFDRILVDAPCSGEGMFRKNPEAPLEWSEDSVSMCAERQDRILSAAAAMLRPGGRIVYSTCTFSRREDEECADRFLSSHPDFSLIKMEKLLPHLIRGEGQFAALLEHKGSRIPRAGSDFKVSASGKKPSLEVPEELKKLLRISFDPSRLLPFGDQLYYLPEDSFPLKALKVIRPGLHLGTYKKNRFEPSHALALSLRPKEALSHLSLTYEEAVSYIAGNQIPGDERNGWTLLSVYGYSIGFGKVSSGVIKNHYPKGLREELSAHAPH